MDKISDEIIMAYVDGELDEEQAEMVAKALETDPRLREKANLFQDTNSMLQGIYDAPLHEQVPARLLNTARTYQPETLPMRIGTWFRRFMQAPALRPALASAFVILLFVGVGMISRLTLSPDPGNNGYPALLTSDEFNQILETKPSGEAVLVEKYATEVIPVTTFQDKSCRFCRQFEAEPTTNDHPTLFQGIACRNQGGVWSTVAFSAVSDQAQKQPKNNYELAGAGEPMEKTSDHLRAGPILSAEQETELILQRWELERVITTPETDRP